MALRKAEREARRADAEKALRRSMGGWPKRTTRVRVTLQDGRQRPRHEGRVTYVATSGAFALLEDGEEAPLHVPLDRVRKVEVL